MVGYTPVDRTESSCETRDIAITGVPSVLPKRPEGINEEFVADWPQITQPLLLTQIDDYIEGIGERASITPESTGVIWEDGPNDPDGCVRDLRAERRVTAFVLGSVAAVTVFTGWRVGSEAIKDLNDVLSLLRNALEK